jgi:hypothetical protein
MTPLDIARDVLDSYDFVSLISKKVKEGTIKVYLDGHNPSNPSGFDHLLFGLRGNSTLIKAAVETGTKLQEPIPCTPLSTFCCSECGENIPFNFDGVSFRSTKSCPYQNGLKSYNIYLNVPSGKIVVSDDFREWFRTTGNYNIGSKVGIIKEAEKNAAVGMACGYVGNTCPAVYKLSTECLYIAQKKPIPDCRKVAGITTDWWWYSIVDYDQYLARVKEKPPTFIKVRPGVFRFSNNHNNKKYFAKIDWIREPDPVIDYEAIWQKLNFSAEQIVYEKLHGENAILYTHEIDVGKREKNDAIMQAANQIMFALNVDYVHQNGWFSENPDLESSTPEIEIPIFTKNFNWFEFYENGIIPRAAGISENEVFLNKSFVNLACNVCQCIVRNNNANKKLALKCIKGFYKKQPEFFPDYCKDLL